jgi:drug/metabolite transporter (DMT)-like permease
MAGCSSADGYELISGGRSVPDASRRRPPARLRREAVTQAIAIVLALGAALSNAAAAFFEQDAAKRVEGDQDVPLSQWWNLIKQQRWLGGQLADVSAFGLQAVALAFGGLIVVEPLLVMSLPFAVGLRLLFQHENPRRRGVIGSVLCVGGLSLFLLFARPTPGHGKVTLAEAWPVAVGLAVLIAGSLTLAMLTRDNWRAIGFALSAAAFYGVTAASVKVVTTQIGHGFLAVFTSWAVYAVIVCGLSGVVMIQNALKPGALAAPVSVLTVGDPLVGVVLGILWLGESIQTSWWALTAEFSGIAAVVAGVVVLAGQSKDASAGGEDDEDAGDEDDKRADSVAGA